MSTDTCHFCNGPDAYYQKRDENGAWADSCYACAVPVKTHVKPKIAEIPVVRPLATVEPPGAGCSPA